MSILAGKKVIIIGDRDGIPGTSYRSCALRALVQMSSSPLRSASSERPPVQWTLRIRGA